MSDTKTLTRADLSAAIYNKASIPLSESVRLVDGFINEVIEAVSYTHLTLPTKRIV